MSGVDCTGSLADAEQMGLKLTAVRLADGKYQVNRCRLLQAID
jgi:hypothetical protein